VDRRAQDLSARGMAAAARIASGADPC
jgi:hypothetical protein